MMAEEALVTVRVNKYIDGDQVDFGVPVRFRPVIEDPRTEVRRLDESRKIVTIVVPISRYRGTFASVYLPWGDYNVEAVMPSGEALEIQEPSGSHGRVELAVSPDTRNAEYDAIEVVLRGEPSPNEWRSWANFAGAQLASPRQEMLESRRRMAFGSLPDSRLQVTVGSLARSEILPRFDPKSWSDWLEFLNRRFDRGHDSSPDIKLDQDDSGLKADVEGGYEGTPLRIKFVQRDASKIGLDARDIGERRTYAAISGLTGTRLVAIPWPWGESAYVEGRVPFELLALEENGELRCEPVLRDARWSGLVAYLNSGRVDLAGEILSQANDALFEKFQNPLAAAVGGYVLLSSKQVDAEGRWPDWLRNLAERFPFLPDGLILRARWLLAQNKAEYLPEAHDLLYKSYQLGIPYFTTGVVWLIEGLEQTSIDCPTCTEILRTVRGVARSMDLSQAFTSFSIAKPRTREMEETSPEVDTLPGQALLEPDLQQFLLGRQSETAGFVTSQWQALATNQFFINQLLTHQRQEVSKTQLLLTHRERLTPKKN
ncbi:hypothetical protein [Rhizobium leguminosarum]|uniref:hypothetical protein n=1 Tax=Rhizobium leguminosarum TaxID=384 RepID=UPI001C904459|nr:hypothetical protein [Rhizobium leguminosarum]MBY2989005.1 hypothetical protein [Rhizobium leguminosarum]